MKYATPRLLLILCLVVAAATISFSQTPYWQANSIPGVTTTINAAAFTSTGHLFVGTNGDGLYRTTDNGATWTRVDNGNMKRYYYTIAVDHHDNIYAGSYLGDMRISKDDGATWTSSRLDKWSPKKKARVSDTTIVTSIAFDSHDNIFVGTGGDGLFVSSDTGWVSLADNLLADYIDQIVIDKFNDTWVGGFGAGINRSQDGGQTWNYEANQTMRVNCMVTDHAGRLFAGSDMGMFVNGLTPDSIFSTDANNVRHLVRVDTVHAGWNQYDGSAFTGQPGHGFVLSLGVSPTNRIFAGTFGQGIFHSVNHGQTWADWNSGLTNPKATVTAIAVGPTGYVFAGCSTGEVFRSIAPEPVPAPVTAPRIDVPSVAHLEQNFPNPFNPSTTIPFTLYQDSYARLVVYNSLGQEVARLVDGPVTAGKHEVRWNASSVPSGVYFYHLQSGSSVQTGKLTLMK